jgi:tetratricopeptide (TPR) repeat protein
LFRGNWGSFHHEDIVTGFWAGINPLARHAASAYLYLENKRADKRIRITPNRMNTSKNSKNPETKTVAKDLTYGDAVNLKNELTSEIKAEVMDDIKKWLCHWGWVPFVVVGGVLTFFGLETYEGLKKLEQNILASASTNFECKVRQQFSDANISNKIDYLIRLETSSLIKTQVEEFATPAIKKEIDDLRATHIDPLKSSFSSLHNNISNTTDRVKDMLVDIKVTEQKYKNLSGDIGLLRLHADAKLGSRQAFVALQSMSTNSQKETAVYAQSLITDLVKFYRAFKDERTYRNPNGIVVTDINPITGQKILLPAETLFRRIMTEQFPEQQCNEIDIIAERPLAYFVEDLVRVANIDPDLFVASRSVSAIEKFTGMRFKDTPPFDDVSMWWNNFGQTNITYKSPFPLIEKGNIAFNAQKNDEALHCYEMAVTNRQGLSLTHYNMARIYAGENDLMQLTNQLAIAMSEADGQIEAMFMNAHVLLLTNTNKQEEAVAYIAKAMPFLPNAKDVVANDSRFISLKDNPAFLKLIKKGD